MKKRKMVLALMAALCVVSFSSGSVKASSHGCDTCGIGLMIDHTAERIVGYKGDVICNHHKYGIDEVYDARRLKYSKCNYCDIIIYNGDWYSSDKIICHGFD